MSLPSIARPAARPRLTRVADGLAVAAAVALPWSSSAVLIFVLLLLLALLFLQTFGDVRREAATAAGGLPVLLVALAALGMTWADVSWSERLGGLDSYIKLLLIPILLAYFRRSDCGLRVLAGYLISCTALLALSSSLILSPQAGFLFTNYFGVPVKTTATQSGQFVTCMFALLFLATEAFRRGHRIRSLGMVALALVFLANILTLTEIAVVPIAGLIIIPVLLVLLGFKQLPARSMLGLLAGTAIVCTVVWASSPSLRAAAVGLWQNVQPFPGNNENLAGSRPEFWKKSLGFIAAAPILGHGTGAVPQLFARSAVGQTGYSARLTTDPLQQTLAIGIQLGIVGIAVLWAMWASHVLLFRGDTLTEWIGLMVVVQNIVGSLLNSHLFDFTQGWIYVFGVSIAGGMVRRRRVDKMMQ
jgi:O-antigen ligase